MDADSVSSSLLFENQAAWEAWLDDQHTSSTGLWLRLAKRGAALTSISYLEAVESALCYGWIDAQKKGLDDVSWLQRFTPRKTDSIWSKVNRAKAEALIQQGRMRPAGLAAVERARQNGRWQQAYDSPATATPPDDLLAAFDRTPEAGAFFATLNSQNRYAILFRIQTAKRPETRQKRVEQLVAMLARGEKLYP